MNDWAGKEKEDDSGYLRYSKIHAWDQDGRALCGAREPAGEWVAPEDSCGDTCKKCKRIAD